MVLFQPIADALVALLFVGGSPAIGYMWVRAIVPHNEEWKPWKRMGAGIFIGIAWSLFLISLFFYRTTPVSPALVGEFSLYAIGGLLGLSLLIGLITNGVWKLVLTHAQRGPLVAKPAPVTSKMPAKKTVTGSPTITRSPDEKEFFPKQKQPFKLATFKQQSSKTKAGESTVFNNSAKEEPPASPHELEDPILENDIMDMLSDDNSASPKNALERDTHSTNPELEDFPEFSPKRKKEKEKGFEETLAQLQRDLKDFNDTMKKKPKRKNP